CGEAQNERKHRKTTAEAGEYKAEIIKDLQPQRSRSSRRHCQRGQRHPKKQRPRRHSRPDGPASYQRAVWREQTSLDAASPKADTGQKINGVVEGAAELEPERPKGRPCRRGKDEGNRDVSDGRSDHQAGKISHRPSTCSARKPDQRVTPLGGEPVKRRSSEI